jgi:hypothetical protein
MDNHRSPDSRGATTPTKAHDDAARPLRQVGYWRNPDDSRTQSLPDPMSFVDASWDRSERKRVIRYLRAGQDHFACHGYSWCRFKCGISDTRMGTRDLTDGYYVWPEGLAHYLEAHAVKPPEEFLDHVRRRTAQRPVSLVQRLIARLVGDSPARS